MPLGQQIIASRAAAETSTAATAASSAASLPKNASAAPFPYAPSTFSAPTEQLLHAYVPNRRPSCGPGPVPIKKYKTDPSLQVKLSGNGNIWEYYHFLVDFVPWIVHHFRNDTCSVKLLYVPNWSPQHRDDRFHFTKRNDQARSVSAHADFLLGPIGLELVFVDSPSALHRVSATVLTDPSTGKSWNINKRAWSQVLSNVG